MLLFDNAPESTYEEIKTWYPVWYRDVFEMDALWRIWGKHLDDVKSGIIRAVGNLSIEYADAATLSALEAFLGIVYDGARTLAERRNVIKAFILGQGHFGQAEIRELLAYIVDGELEINLVGGSIQIRVVRDITDRFNLYDAHLILDPRIPAHLALDLVDDLRPIQFANQNTFVFINLRLPYWFLEPTAYPRGARLDGYYDLDSPHLLDSVYPGPLMPHLQIGIAVRNDNNMIVMDNALTFMFLFENVNNFVYLPAFGAVATHSLRVVNKDVQIGLRFAQNNAISGTLETGDGWKLDGSVLLDGSKKLESSMKEDL